jgi:hypothetical protein
VAYALAGEGFASPAIIAFKHQTRTGNMGFDDDNGAGTLADDREHAAKERAYLQQRMMANRGISGVYDIAGPALSNLRQAALHAAILKHQSRRESEYAATAIDLVKDAEVFAKFLRQPTRPYATGNCWKELTGHAVDGAAISDNELSVHVLDHLGPGGAHHDYIVNGDTFQVALNFQNGPIAEAGVNGITHEVLLAILIDRLEGFQAGEYANEYNAAALDHLKSAQGALFDRTRERMSRGVEGTHQK